MNAEPEQAPPPGARTVLLRGRGPMGSAVWMVKVSLLAVATLGLQFGLLIGPMVLVDRRSSPWWLYAWAIGALVVVSVPFGWLVWALARSRDNGAVVE